MDYQTMQLILVGLLVAVIMYFAAKNGKLPGLKKPTKLVGGDPFKPQAFTAPVILPNKMNYTLPDVVTKADLEAFAEKLTERLEQPKEVQAWQPATSNLDQLYSMVTGAAAEKKAAEDKMAAVKTGLASLGLGQ